MGPDETRPQAELEHGSRASIKRTVLQKGACAKRPRFFGLWPLLGGDDASMASCGVIRSGSGEPWVDWKNEERSMELLAQSSTRGESRFSPLIVLLNRRLDDYGPWVFPENRNRRPADRSDTEASDGIGARVKSSST